MSLRATTINIIQEQKLVMSKLKRIFLSVYIHTQNIDVTYDHDCMFYFFIKNNHYKEKRYLVDRHHISAVANIRFYGEDLVNPTLNKFLKGFLI